jgi:murein DD-endopeptidase MepM/ murein hydrolase activator NlpD
MENQIKTKKNKIKYLMFAIFLLFFLFNNSHFALGQDDTDKDALNQEINDINGDITNKKDQIKKIQQKQEEYSAVIKQKQSEKTSLNNQLAILDNRLAKSELDIEMVKMEIDGVILEIKKTDVEITEKNQEIEKNKQQLSDVINLMNKTDNTSSLEIMLLNKSLADFLSQFKYLEDMNDSIGESLKDLEYLSEKLNSEKQKLIKQNEQLAKLKNELEQRNEQLASEKDTKTNILLQVNSSEKEYQRLLALAKKEQEQASSEIASMEKLMRAKLARLNDDKLEMNDSGFIWPVTKNIITAYFHDPDYPFKKIFEHPAVDIRAAQGTPIKAALSGYVARAKDSGLGYSYIMLIHGDGLSTVYGHVSKIYVKDEEYVIQGQTIGLSGGLPGTAGAGNLTTGSHLHFEVRLNGIPVDPLSYLP